LNTIPVVVVVVVVAVAVAVAVAVPVVYYANKISLFQLFAIAAGSILGSQNLSDKREQNKTNKKSESAILCVCRSGGSTKSH
jgi:high-affinity Fe2+/Pb2+ permease